MRYELGIGDWTKHKAMIYQELQAKNITKLAKSIKNMPPSKVKHELYFVRGRADYRNNMSMKDIQFLVIDGDAGFIILCNSDEPTVRGKKALVNPDVSPNPYLAHMILKKLGFAHLIYPSWSNGQVIPKKQRTDTEINRKVKWRLMVPCSGIPADDPQLLRDHTDMLHRLLQDHGCWIVPVPESYVLSQAWYLSKPKGSKYHDGNQYFHSEGEIWDVHQLPKIKVYKPYYATHHAHRPLKANGNRGMAHKYSIKDIHHNCKIGLQLHPSMMAYCRHYLSQGDMPEKVKESLMKLIDGSRSKNRLKNVSQEIDEMLNHIQGI